MWETLILCRSTQVLLIKFTDEHFHFFPFFPYDILMRSCNFSHSIVNLNGDTSRNASALTHSSQDAYIYRTSQRTPCPLMPDSKGYETNACMCVFCVTAWVPSVFPCAINGSLMAQTAYRLETKYSSSSIYIPPLQWTPFIFHVVSINRGRQNRMLFSCNKIFANKELLGLKQHS